MSTLMQEYRFHGPAMTVSAMCASGNAGLITAKSWLDAGIVDTGVPATAVRYLNAHAPGTAQCDRAEAAVLDRLFPAHTGIYSVKSLTGHCQGAASAVEVAVTALGCDRGLVPAPPTVAPGHPQLLNGPTPITGGITVKSALGMGGHNSVVVLAPPA